MANVTQGGREARATMLTTRDGAAIERAALVARAQIGEDATRMCDLVIEGEPTRSCAELRVSADFRAALRQPVLELARVG